MIDKPTYEELEQRVKELEKESAGYKRSNEELQLHKEIMKNMAEGVVLVRVKDAVIVYANRKFEKIFGYNITGLLTKALAGRRVANPFSSNSMLAATASNCAGVGIPSGSPEDSTVASLNTSTSPGLPV